MAENQETSKSYIPDEGINLFRTRQNPSIVAGGQGSGIQ
ncbi:MAG: hypothetical protein RLZZ28_2173 [Bacteroidota bacterium]